MEKQIEHFTPVLLALTCRGYGVLVSGFGCRFDQLHHWFNGMKRCINRRCACSSIHLVNKHNDKKINVTSTSATNLAYSPSPRRIRGSSSMRRLTAPLILSSGSLALWVISTSWFSTTTRITCATSTYIKHSRLLSSLVRDKCPTTLCSK